MDSRPVAAIVMAAGKGTRMKSALPKVLHPIAGVSLLGHVLGTCARAGVSRVFVVVGHGAEQVIPTLPEGVVPVLQAEQLGTGHAIQQVAPHLAGFDGEVVILSGDVPLLAPETLEAMLAAHRGAGTALTMLTAELADPTGYGRVKRDAAGALSGVVEHKDASEAERAIREVNMGTYVARWDALASALGALSNDNAQGEYYLTDVVETFVKAGSGVTGHLTADAAACMGCNTREELARLSAEYTRRQTRRWMAEGVSFTAPESVVIGPGVRFGQDVTVEFGVTLLGATRVGSGSTIQAHSRLENAEIGEDTVIAHSTIVNSKVGSGVVVGPYAHLREHSDVGDGCRVGNFVELKKTTFGRGAKAAHLAYLGDALVGERVNFSCGAITVNYDGRKKHRTIVEDGAFVGCNVNLVAPVTVGTGAFVAAGSTITHDVPAHALAIGRARQVDKPEWASNRNGAVSSPPQA